MVVKRDAHGQSHTIFTFLKLPTIPRVIPKAFFLLLLLLLAKTRSLSCLVASSGLIVIKN